MNLGPYTLFDVVEQNKKASLLIREIRLALVYRGKGSNLHTQRAPDPKSGVSTNSTTAA